MSTSAVRTVSATCACGATFDREVKRGRPQVWCPACIAVPFYERTKTAVVVEAGETVVVSDRISNENDPLDSVRDILEVEVSAIYAEHKLAFASLVQQGHSPALAAEAVHKVSSEAILATYAKYRR